MGVPGSASDGVGARSRVAAEATPSNRKENKARGSRSSWVHDSGSVPSGD